MKALIIGAGLGGLASAIRLRAKGYDVEVFESSDQAGGRASLFERDGFKFDAGPTVITAPYLIEELFSLTGRRMQDYVELTAVDPFYRVVNYDGSTFDYMGDEERLFEQIRNFNPKDVDGYKKLAQHSEKIFDVGYTQLSDQPFDSITSMLKVAPKMIALQNYRSVYGLVSKYIKDDRLRQVFSFQPLLIGGNPFSVTSIYLLIHWLERKWGVYYPKGGTSALVKAMVKLAEETGVVFNYNAPIDEIDIKNQKAVGLRTSQGQYHKADLVISNGDATYTYAKLIANKYRKKYQDRKVLKRSQSPSLFVVYFGTNKKYPELAHHTIKLCDSYHGLIDNIFNKKTLSDKFSLYLHSPSRTDDSMAPAGKDSFYVLSPVPNNLSGINWAKEGEAYKNKILQHLNDSIMPDLLDHIETEFFITPNYFEENLRSVHGAAFGIEPTLRQSAYFRYHNQSEDIQDLYFVGAGTHPGAGVPGVLSSAKVLDNILPAINSFNINKSHNSSSSEIHV